MRATVIWFRGMPRARWVRSIISVTHPARSDTRRSPVVAAEFAFQAGQVFRRGGNGAVGDNTIVAHGHDVRGLVGDGLVTVLDYSLDETALNLATIDRIAMAFGKINGIFNIWPYWREYVQSSISRIGLPPVAIPLMTGASVVAYYNAKEAFLTPQVAPAREESGPRLGGAAAL